MFKATKKKLLGVSLAGAIEANPALSGRIRSELRCLQEKQSVVVSNDQNNKIVDACVAIVWTLQGCVNPERIMRGFEDSGQVPPSFGKVMNLCYRKPSKALLSHLKSRTTEDVEFFLTHGQLTEAQLEAAGIPKHEDDTGIPRDCRHLNHQRATLLNHSETIQRYQAYYNKGLDLGNVVTNCEQPQEKKELKQAAKNISQKEKIENRK